MFSNGAMLDVGAKAAATAESSSSFFSASASEVFAKFIFAAFRVRYSDCVSGLKCCKFMKEIVGHLSNIYV